MSSSRQVGLKFTHLVLNYKPTSEKRQIKTNHAPYNLEKDNYGTGTRGDECCFVSLLLQAIKANRGLSATPKQNPAAYSLGQFVEHVAGNGYIGLGFSGSYCVSNFDVILGILKITLGWPILFHIRLISLSTSHEMRSRTSVNQPIEKLSSQFLGKITTDGANKLNYHALLIEHPHGFA
ncbi:hypothetical protein E3N88_31004 [Mikania micrantha]|uniref:Uncharacterized protein n=1 Tax=Mikania micrantha TaxID=192012 RepID=A0A5N6MNF2_9ASTR|nr:hypothetical protein E3N88_31004 [Mikania micrantha]